jgi:hypothetical protein
VTEADAVMRKLASAITRNWYREYNDGRCTEPACQFCGYPQDSYHPKKPKHLPDCVVHLAHAILEITNPAYYAQLPQQPRQ